MDLLRSMMHLEENRIPYAVVTVVEKTGAAPREPGAKMIVLEDGSSEGTVGGGELEHLAIKEALDCLRVGENRLKRYSLAGGNGDPSASICGGAVSLFIEVHRPRWRLIVAGGGHVGRAVARLGTFLGSSVTVVDHRPEIANADRFPDCEVVCGEFTETLRALSPDETTAVVVVTRGHEFDKEALAAVLHSKAGYIGMIGSVPKVTATLESLLREGYAPDAVARVHAPIGLDIGAQTPEEIAVAVAAEIVMVRKGGTGGKLTVAPRIVRDRSERAQ